MEEIIKINTRPKIVTIVGQTATGKSDFAVALARILNGEIISADSRQVYKDLNIGTNKITKREMKRVPHYLLDVASPKKTFTVTDWRTEAEKTIQKIIARDKLPIICGGTGFYVSSLVDDMQFPEVKADHKLRAGLEKKSLPELVDILNMLVPNRPKDIDEKNPRRLIRAIEIANELGYLPARPERPERGYLGKYDVLQIGLSLPEEELKKKIKTRLRKEIRKGLFTEGRKLHRQGLSLSRMHELGLEYHYLALWLSGDISKRTLEDELGTAIWQYAKRQRTWFRKDKRILWVSPTDIERTVHLVKIFLGS